MQERFYGAVYLAQFKFFMEPHELGYIFTYNLIVFNDADFGLFHVVWILVKVSAFDE